MDSSFFVITGAAIGSATPFGGNPLDDPALLQFNEFMTIREVWRTDNCNINAEDLERGGAYGCSGEICEYTANASGINFGLLRPSLIWAVDSSFAINHNLCYGDTAYNYFRLYNGGTAYAKDIKFDIRDAAGNPNTSGNPLDTNNIFYRIVDLNGVEKVGKTSLNPYKYSHFLTSASYSCAGDTNGVYRAHYDLGTSIQLEVGDTMLISVGYKQVCDCEPNEIYYRNYIYMGGVERTFQDPCDLGPYNIKTSPTQGGSGAQIGNSPLRAYYTSLPEGPIFLADGQRGCMEYDFTGYANRYYYYGSFGSLDMSNSVLQMQFIIGEGLDFVNDATHPFAFVGSIGDNWSPSAIYYTDHNGGPDTVTVRFTGQPTNGFRALSSGNGLLAKMCIEADCSEMPACGGGLPSIDHYITFSPDTTCNSCDLMDVYIEQNWDIEVDCPCGVHCRGFVHTDYSLERNNFGCGDNNNSSLFESGETLDLNLVNKRRLLPGDTLRARTTGYFATDDTVTTWPYAYVKTTIPANIDSFRSLDANMVIWDASALTSYSCNVLQQFNSGNDILTNISPENLKLLGCSLPAGFNSYDQGDSVQVNVFFTVNDLNRNQAPEFVEVWDNTFAALKPWVVELDSQYRCTNRREKLTLIGVYYTNSSYANWGATGGCNPQYFYYLDYNGFGNNPLNDYFRYEIRRERRTVDRFRFKMMPDMDMYRARLLMYARVPHGKGSGALADRYRNIYLGKNSQYLTWTAEDSIIVDVKGIRDSLGWTPLNGCYPDQGMYSILYVYPRPTCETIIDNPSDPAGTSPHDSVRMFYADIQTDPTAFFRNTDQYSYLYPNGGNYNYTGGAKLNLQTATNELFIGSRKGCFEFDIINSTDYDASFSYFTVNSPNGNVAIIEVHDITSGSPVPVTKTPYGIYQLGTFPRQLSGTPRVRKYRVCVLSNSCDPDSVLVDIGYDCVGYPLTPQEAVCKNPSTVIVRPYPSEIQQVVRAPGSEITVDLCDTINYMVQVSASKLGSLTDIEEIFRIPFGSSYVPESFQIAWPVPVNGADTTWSCYLLSDSNLKTVYLRLNIL